MKTIYFIFLASLFINSAISQVTPNSNRFGVENYIAIDNNGEYYPYTTHGFYENAAKGATARIFLLPQIKLDLNKIKYIDSFGIETYQSNEDIRTLIIPVTLELVLPNESQKAAIAAAIKKHTTIQAFYPPIVKNTAGITVVNPVVNSNQYLYNQIVAMSNNYETSSILPQQQLIDDYNTGYRAEIISLTELEVIVEASNEIVYSKRFPGTWITTGGTLQNIMIDNPTEFVKNLIASGNGNILISYKFKDSKSSTISAQINATAIVDQFLSEAYTSSVSSKSSGWSFLGLGSSRKSMKSSMDQQINIQVKENSIANTTIEMYDADEDMIKHLEESFFPTISKQEAIQNHIDAAEKAKLEGNTSLQQLHLQYVKELKADNPNLTPNIDAAVAALGKNDYIGFLAHGVRWGSNSSSGNNSFRRVLSSNEMSSMLENWNQTKVISLQHAVTQPVLVSKEVMFKSSLGMIDGMSFQNSLYMFNGYSTTLQNVSGVIIGPITIAGAFHKNNIMPGTLMTKIGSYSVYSPQTVNDALRNYNPGDKVYVTLIMPTAINQNVYQEQRVEVTLGAYPKIN